MIPLHKSILAVLAAVMFIIGIGAGTSLLVVPHWWWLGITCVTALFSLYMWRDAAWMICWILVLFISLGVARSWLVPDYRLDPIGRVTAVHGEIVRLPTIDIDQQRLVVRIDGLIGYVQVKTTLEQHWRRGDLVQLSCDLQAPLPSDDFAYDQYLHRYHISRICHRPDIHWVGQQDSLSRWLTDQSQWLVARVEATIPRPEQTIILGVLFGINQIPDDVATWFRVTGTTHVLVISGWNIVMITALLLAACQYCGLSRTQQALVVGLVLVGYLAMTGWQAPAARATICGVIVVWLKLFGRQQSALYLLVWTAAVMLFYNPLLLWYDAGFQLSFLATLGMIVFQSRVELALQRLPTMFDLHTVLGTTLAANLLTAPLIAYSFHSFSPVAIIANVVIVPLFSVLMFMSLAWVPLVGLSMNIGRIVGLPVYYLIHLCLQIIHWFSQWPYASVTLPQFHMLWLVLIYAGLGIWGRAILKTT